MIFYQGAIAAIIALLSASAAVFNMATSGSGRALPAIADVAAALQDTAVTSGSNQLNELHVAIDTAMKSIYQGIKKTEELMLKVQCDDATEEQDVVDVEEDIMDEIVEIYTKHKRLTSMSYQQ